MLTSPLPLEAENRLRAELNPGEKLLWTSQPHANRLDAGTLFIALFGIPWTAFSIFWVVMASGITSHASSSSSPVPFNLMGVVFPLFGIPFVLVGLGMLSAPYWKRRKAQKTVYALTNQRALILSPTWRGATSIQSITPENLIARTRTQNPDGSGSLLFTRLTPMHRAAGPDGGTYAIPVGFENIPDVRDVDALIERTYRTS